MSLEDLLQRADLWRGGAAPAVSGLPSGFAPLDAQLPGGGWPAGALTEILAERAGIGELSLFVPALARLTRQDRWLTFIAPPYIPYAPAFLRVGINPKHVLVVHALDGREAMWATEQALRADACGAVLAWPAMMDMKRLRRLQLAAETGNTLGLLFRPTHVAGESTPAALRLRLEPAPKGLVVHILKRRGGWPTGPIFLEVDGAVAVSEFSEFSA